MSATSIVPTARSGETGKVVTAREAVRLIRSGDMIAIGGFGGIGLARVAFACRCRVVPLITKEHHPKCRYDDKQHDWSHPHAADHHGRERTLELATDAAMIQNRKIPCKIP
jgi:acyl CoA:acetate/3-ketoacid CoA transferase